MKSADVVEYLIDELVEHMGDLEDQVADLAFAINSKQVGSSDYRLAISDIMSVALELDRMLDKYDDLSREVR